MREDLDDILEKIGAATLTTAEWVKAAEFVGINPNLNNQYKALHAVMVARGGEGAGLARLKAYFFALGLNTGPDNTQWSNIFIGGVLE